MPSNIDKKFKRLMTIVLIRHGSRTPVHSFPHLYSNNIRNIWNCDFESSSINGYQFKLDPKLVDYYPSCEAGSLTIEGSQQHLKLGESVRKYLLNNDNDFDPVLGYESDQIYVRTTAIERTHRSAISFLHGLSLPAVKGELIKLIMGSQTYDLYRPNVRQCADIKEAKYNYTHTEFYKNELIHSVHILKNAYKLLNFDILEINSSGNIDEKLLDELSSKRKLSCDFIITTDCFEQNFEEITNDMLQYCENLFGTIENGYFDIDPYLSFSQGFREIFKLINGRISDINRIRFALYSVHDTTIISVLKALEQKVTRNPPYASHIIIDLFADDISSKKGSKIYIRFSFNGKVLNIPSIYSKVGDGIYEMTDFKNHISSHLTKCNDFDSNI